MDVLIEFCRSGTLGPLTIGATAADVERLLGRPSDIKFVHGDDNWQRYRYGSLKIMLMRGSDRQHHRVNSISVSFDKLPPALPEPIARGLHLDWRSADLNDFLTLLGDAGIPVTPTYDSTKHGPHHQHFHAGTHPVVIIAFDGEVDEVDTG